ncbi:hypothetical protein FAEPRAA2165_01743 [Faecalibacterium duncaniae]|uniref:Uncharacterized protein n=1 Tax=Faecalibacterium duncaniae (strain DSM 17677 / JCM 31915 / A2-165) TaxID=411483 RepID=C7H617_FAED2|nr:hypothetical protein FAEPRAA2165_01743 [Faecalibacterium duncaniae]
MTYGRKKASFAPAELPGPHRGDLGGRAAAGHPRSISSLRLKK